MMFPDYSVVRRLLGAALLGILITGLPGCAEDAAKDASREIPRNVRVLSMEQTAVTEFFEISGPVAPVKGTTLSSQESGPVVAIPVKKGQSVKKGTVIIEQERDILKAEMEAHAKALELQAYNVDKVRQLHAAGKVSRIELLTAESAYAQAKSLATISRERYRRAGIAAPFDGVVVDRFVELGELVNPGRPTVRLIDPYVLKLEAYLTDTQVGWVEVGQDAAIILGDNPQPAAGRVSWVGFEADRLTGKFKVEIELPNRDLKFNSGVIGRARLGKNRVTDVVAIPRDAILPGRAGPTVFVVEGDRAVQRVLELGADQGLMVVVRKGLESGDLLVVRGHRDLRDGSLVKVTETASAADGSVDTDPRAIERSRAGSRIASPADTDGSALADDDVEAGR